MSLATNLWDAAGLFLIAFGLGVLVGLGLYREW
jgi:hypothetical protein